MVSRLCCALLRHFLTYATMSQASSHSLRASAAHDISKYCPDRFGLEQLQTTLAAASNRFVTMNARRA